MQSAGFVRGNHVPPAASGGHTKHFFRMANRNAAEPMTSEQVRVVGRGWTPAYVSLIPGTSVERWTFCSAAL